jgi:chromosome segregation ATPase
VKEENEDPANGTKGSNEMSLSREVQEIAKEKAAREVQVQEIAKKKAATRSTRIRAQEERVQKAQEKKIKEKKIEELQREYEGMEREFAHYSRRRDTHIVKVDIVKESVTELNMEIRKALKRQGETKERLEAIKATSAVRRNHIKSMVREMDGDPALLHKVNGVDALMKREYKATRIMDQILSDL